MILNKMLAGTLQVNEGESIMIGDPGYDDTGFLLTKKNVKPGEYNCYSYVGTIDGWGERPWRSEIVLNNDIVKSLADCEYKWEDVSEIGVDAGMAGYFINKPDFDSAAWEKFCEYVFAKKNYANRIKETFLKQKDEQTHLGNWSGFFTESGCGDGVYTVQALKYKDDIVGLRLLFA